MKEYEDLLIDLIEKDDRYIVMTAENRALIRNLPSIIGAKFIDTGITEQTMIGMAAGLALQGRIPICHALAAFLTMRAYEFIRTDIGIANLNVKLSGFIPGILSDANGPTHQAIEDISIMRGIPFIHVFAPADAHDMMQMLPSIWTSPHPSYIRIVNRQSSYKHSTYEYGRAEVVFQGTDATILVYGFLFDETYKAALELRAKGCNIGLINMRSLKPIDEHLLLEVIGSQKPIIVIEDHLQTGGLYSIMAEILIKHRLTAAVHSISFGDRWFKPALLAEVLDFHKMNAFHFTQTILKILSKKTTYA